MKRRNWTRALSFLLVICLLLGMMPSAFAGSAAGQNVTFEEVLPDENTADLAMETGKPTQPSEEEPAEDEMVRVSIVLEEPSVLEQGYEISSVNSNTAAQSYRKTLETEQQAIQAKISQAVQGKLKVAWNLTLVTNVISADIRYGDLEKVEATPGVSRVVLENRYDPCETETDTVSPNMGSATNMTGSGLAWLAGYTGAGSRIAIIDTGLDTDHQSVDNGAYLYALAENAKAANMTEEEYMTSLNMLTPEEIANVLPQLNVYKNSQSGDGTQQEGEPLTGEALYATEKIAFAYNYIDRDLDVTHDNDNQGGHGSHVAGIAAANRYIPAGDSYSPAVETVQVTGVAPDAQLLVMKVFGKNGGAYESDYMAAIEDAIVLGADVVNLSLGSATPGFATNDLYQDVLNQLAETDTVVTMSAGNSAAWPESSANGYLYAEDVNFYTGGTPGTYPNAFTVASVDNDGMVGYGFQIADRTVVYTENRGPFADTLASLDTTGSGTEYPYVFLDGLGTAADYEGIDVTGKVVFVSRGEIDFSAKAKAAFQAGAIACVIYNNVAGAPIQMDLSNYYDKAPCVGITKADADAIRAASTAADGYYSGTMTIGSQLVTAIYDSEYYTMSQFSSWGVPGNLTLKPEITAPGGNIYSINGATRMTDQYTVMSGTSMAAPHNSGLAALLAQYIREEGLAEKLEISPRVLIQSLLMSTATPILEESSGLPYPVIRQGAGLANINNAMNATSYVLVDGQPDGKVKAELGDDPERKGVYTLDYTLHNMTDEDQQYTLDAEVYTQAVFQDETSGQWFTDYALTQLNALTTYTVAGEEILPEAGALAGCDFNGDGRIREDDGQALLDYAVGKRSELSNQDRADLNGDGQITAYDAELFLSRLGKHVVSLPANGSVTVSVTITLPEDVKAELDAVYTSGAYIEAYVTATPFATEEGVLSSAHSIPVLGFYGGWDEADMFDKVTHNELAAGVNEKISYIPTGGMAVVDYNYVSMTRGDESGSFYLGGNPYATDDDYLPERNAIRSNAGDAVESMNFCLIRNAGALRSTIANGQTGEIYAQEVWEQVYPAFYFPNYSAWQNMSQSVLPEAETGGWQIADESGSPLPEGTQLELSLQAVPELYVDQTGYVDWDQLSEESTTLSMPVTVDNTAPVLKNVSVGTQTDPVTGESWDFVEAVAQDDRYVAAVILMTPGGTKIIGRQSANQRESGVESRVRLDISGVFGSAFRLAAVDYAGNATYYQVTVSEPFEGPTAMLYGATTIHNGATWERFSSDANYDYEMVLETNDSLAAGAAYGDGYLFYSGTRRVNNEQKSFLFVVDYPSFENPVIIGEISESPYYSKPISYMTYNTADGNLYYVRQRALYAVDVADATETLIAPLDTDMVLSGIAYSTQEQCFYIVGATSIYDRENKTYISPAGLYRFILPGEGESIVLEQVTDFGIWSTNYAYLALDEKQNSAYLLRNANTRSDLLTYEFASDRLTVTGRTEPLGSVVLPDDGTADDNSIFRTQPTSITLDADSMIVFADSSKTLTAEVGPWCLQDKSVTWSSSDETVASVDQNGNVTGISEGTAVITASSTLDSSISAYCTVNVVGSSFTFQGVGTKANGESELFTYDLRNLQLTPGPQVTDMEGNALTVESAAVNPDDGTVWVQDTEVDEEGNGYQLHSLDPVTGKSTYDSLPNTNTYQDGSLLFSDLVYDDWNNLMLGVNGTDPMFFSTNPPANDIGGSWFAFNEGRRQVALARGSTGHAGIAKVTQVYALDAKENEIIVRNVMYDTYFNSWAASNAYYDLEGVDFTFSTDANGVYQESMIYDSVTGTPILFHGTENGTEIYAVILDTRAETAELVSMGTIQGYQSVAMYAGSFEGEITAQAEQLLGEIEAQDQQILLTTAEEAPAQGSTNMAAGVEPTEDKSVVTVTLRADEAVGSGMAEIELGEGLTLQGLESPAALSSYTVEDGAIRFAYAHHAPLEADSVIAVLRLAYDGEDTEVTVHETERSGKTVDVTTSVKISGACDGGEDCPSGACSDLDTGAWYHPYTDFVLESGLMQGVGGGRFSPNNSLTRGQLVTTLYRMAGEPEVEQTSSFTDLREGAYYADAVAWAQENGIAKGVTETRFAPEQSVTREQAAVFLHRFVTEYWEQAAVETADLTEFPDGGQVSLYARTAMAWAVGAGFLEGYEDGALRPTRVLTRVQMAKLLTLLADYI